MIIHFDDFIISRFSNLYRYYDHVEKSLILNRNQILHF